MPVGAGADDVEAGAERQLLAEGQAAVRQLVVGEFGLAQRPLERREEMAQRLLVVPDMGAAAFAGALADVLALPAPELAAFEADDGRGAQQRQRAGHGVDDLGRQRRAEQAVAEGEVAPLELVPAAKRLGAAGERIGPLRRVVVASTSASARPGIPARRACCGRPSRCRQRIVPGDGEAHASRVSPGGDA